MENDETILVPSDDHVFAVASEDNLLLVDGLERVFEAEPEPRVCLDQTPTSEDLIGLDEGTVLTVSGE